MRGLSVQSLISWTRLKSGNLFGFARLSELEKGNRWICSLSFLLFNLDIEAWIVYFATGFIRSIPIFWGTVFFQN